MNADSAGQLLAANKNARRAVLAVIWMLVAAYTLPVYVVILSAFLTGGFRENSFILGMFVSLVSSPDDAYALYHKVLIPLTAGFAVVAFRTRAATRVAGALIAFTLLSIVLSIGLNLFMNSGQVGVNLRALEDDVFTFPFDLSRQFLNRLQEMLGTLLMTLLGLAASEAVEVKE